MKIIVERPKCIGCGSCVAVCPKFFEMADDDDGLVSLKGSTKNDDDFEEVEIEDSSCAQEAVEICPVQIIKIN